MILRLPPLWVWGAVGSSALIACTDSTPAAKASGGGTIVITASSDPNLLFPPTLVLTQARQVAEQIYDYLVVVGPELNTFADAGYIPRLAQSWSWSRDSLSIAFKIHPKARWHDGVKADAGDVRFTYKVYTNRIVGSSTATELSNVDSVTTSDSSTAVFWYHARSPHQLLDASQIMILPRHLLENVPMDSLAEVGARETPVGTGRFRFKRWIHGSLLEISADTSNYRGRPGVDRVIWSVTPGSATALTKLLGGEADIVAGLRAENIKELKRHPELREISFPGTDYFYLAFNLRLPILASRELRRALTMAVDRAALVSNAYDTLARVAVGPTVRVFPTTDTTLKQIPFDPQRAKAILDSLGWRYNAARKTRARSGVELAFTILYPSTSQARESMAEVIQQQLSSIGVRTRLESMEMNTFQSRLESRDFDAAIGQWHLGAAPYSVPELWGGAAAREKKGRNYAAYSNPRFDAYVDSAIAARTLTASRMYFTAAYQTIIDDAPAIWLSEPKTVIGLNRRIRTGLMRPDAWWFDLGSWSIPKSEQIDRDRVPADR
jgi:peptide/nickel transport system substrate-binding protein